MSKEPDPFRIIANLTHELKTPLHSILSVANILAAETDGSLTEEQKKQVAIIQRNGDHLLELITDLLSYASATSKTRIVKVEKIQPAKIVSALVQEITPLSAKRQILIETDFCSSPEFFYSDQMLFSKIVNNLIGNAIKFTNEGGKIFVTLSEGINNSLVVSITDSGIGMDAMSKEKLFSAFYQADSSSTRQYGGVGLGLSLVKHAVEELEGSIEVQSEIGQGSSFTIILPDISERTSKYEVLLCTDDETIHHAVKALLESNGYLLTLCTRKELLSCIKDKTPSILLLDLPDFDDSQLKEVRSLKEVLSDSPIPIIGMTASSKPRMRSLAIQGGLDDLISKPFDTNDLLSRIKLLVERGHV